MGAEASVPNSTEDQVLHKIAENLHSRQLNVLEAFHFLDVDASGSITWDEFLRGVRHYVPVTPTALMPVFNHLDTDEDGRVSLHELATVVSRYNQKLLSRRLTDQVAQEALERLSSTLARMGKTPHEMFLELDHDQNGLLTWQELDLALTVFQPDLSYEEKSAIFHLFDQDRSGSIQLHEFCQAIKQARIASSTHVEEKIRLIGEKFMAQGCSFSDAFCVFDRNRDGCLSRGEWQRVVAVLGLDSQLSHGDIEAVFQHFDANQDGFMSMAELQRALTAPPAAPPAPPIVYPSLLQSPPPPPPPSPPKAICNTSLGHLLAKEEAWEQEVLDLLQSSLSTDRTGMGIAEVFRRLDLDDSNYMSQSEFDRLVLTYRPDLNSFHLQQLFQKVNRSASGSITIGEFIRRFG